MTSVFKFNFRKPKFNKKRINYRKAGIKNTLKSFLKSRVRYLKRLHSYRNQQRMIASIKGEDLSLITALVRPGTLNLEYQDQYASRRI
jgi:hypothetical protein